MNLQQFLSQQPIDSLIHQYFSLQGQSQKTKTQQNTLINSIVLYIGSKGNYTFNQLYQQCQYQLEVANQQRQAVNKMARLLTGVIGKAGYLLRNVNIILFVDNVLEFLMSKVFITVCSADCIKCIWALVSAYLGSFPFVGIGLKKESSSSGGCCGGNEVKQSKKQVGCCGGNSSKQSKCCNETQQVKPKTSGGCCGGNSQSQSSPTSLQKSRLLQLIKNHQKICHLLITKLFKTFKLHIKAYGFKVRKDIFKLLNYILKFIQFSNPYLSQLVNKTNKPTQLLINDSIPLYAQINTTKQQLIQIIIKNLADQKDPRNMTLIFQNYYLLLQLFQHEVLLLGYKKQIFQNLQVYYPLSMQGDQQGFQIDPQDQFKQKDLIKLLDNCLLHEIFKDEVREMLIQKMLAPPLHEFASLYVKFISKFNPNIKNNNRNLLGNKKTQEEIKEQKHKYLILTMNLLVRLCEEDYLQQNYDNSHQCGDSGCQSQKKCGSSSGSSFSISQLISSILQNVFVSNLGNQESYLIYNSQYEKKFIEFLNNLVVSKIFNHEENNKHAGTIIEIMKVILNRNSQSSLEKRSSITNSNKGCCGSSTSCGSSNSCSPTSCQEETINHKKLVYGRRINYQQMVINFIIYKFMQYWSGKGDIAFKIGILIIVLNKKYQNIAIQKQISSSTTNAKILDLNSQNLLQHLLISLGNIYQNYKQTDQIRIMILKVLMIITQIYKKVQSNKQKQQKSLIKIRKINNSIVYKDCAKIGMLLRSSDELNNSNSDKIVQANQFSKSQAPIIKSYVDYIMQIYFNSYEQEQSNSILSQQITNIIQNIIKFKASTIQTICKIQNQNQLIKSQKYFDIKVYGLMRFLSYFYTNSSQNSSQNNTTQRRQKKTKIYQKQISQASDLLFSIWFNNNKNNRINKKVLDMFKPYTYDMLLHVLVNIFRVKYVTQTGNKQKIQEQTNDKTEQQIQTFFVNVSILGKQLCKKFQEYYRVELEESQENYFKLMKKDVQRVIGNENKNSDQTAFVKLISLYLFKKIWQRTLVSQNTKTLFLQQISSCNQSINSSTLLTQFFSSCRSRILQLSHLISSRSSLQHFNISSMSSLSYNQLTTKLLYIKYLKINKIANQIKFNSSLIDLYENGMVEYFWHRLLQRLEYGQNGMVEEGIKGELIQLIEFIPEKLMVMYSERIIPVVLYKSMNKGKGQNAMVEQKQQHVIRRDEYDFSKVQLICKIALNIPQQSIVTNILPYCLQLLKLSALDCQNNSSLLLHHISQSQVVQTLLNNNKLLYLLIQKSQQQQESHEQKKLKYEKLNKLIFETNKKQFNQYLSRLVYHKKRVIRQSSRNLLMTFQ